MHYNDVIMGGIASQITSLMIVYSVVYSDADKRKHQSSASLAFVRVIHRGPVNYPYKWPVTPKMFPFDDVIMELESLLDSKTASCWLFRDNGRSVGKHFNAGSHTTMWLKLAHQTPPHVTRWQTLRLQDTGRKDQEQTCTHTNILMLDIALDYGGQGSV